MSQRHSLSYVELQKLERRQRPLYKLIGFMYGVLGLGIATFFALAFAGQQNGAFLVAVGIIVSCMVITQLERGHHD